MRGCVLAIAIALPASLFAQAGATRVPFVGCRSDGQVGPLTAPAGTDKLVQIDSAAASRLAYYKAENGSGVLAPRGWSCFGVYGSAGAHLFVAPQPIQRDDLFSSDWRGFTGPAIQVDNISGETSGRFEVAGILARVFPGQRGFVERVIQEKLRPAGDFPFGPFPVDRLISQNNQMVEYQTPARSEGLGTMGRLQADDLPIDGVVRLLDETPDVLFLEVRLPRDLADLASSIIGQLKREGD